MPKLNAKDTGLSAIARGGFINILGLITAFVLNFLFQLSITRTLSTADVGLYNLGFTIASLIGLLYLFGLDRTVVRFIAYYVGRNDRGRELGTIVNSLVIATLLTIVLTPFFWSTAEFIARDIFNIPEFTSVLRVFILSVPFISITRMLIGILQAYKRMKPMVLIEQIYIPIMRILSLFVVLYALGRTSTSASVAFLITSVTGFILAIFYFNHFYVSRKMNIKPISLYADLLLFSWPLFGASLLNTTNNQVEVLFLGIFSTLEQVAIYTVGLKTAITLTIFFQAINLIFAPFIAESYAKKNLDKLSYQFKVVTRWIFTFTLPFGLLLLLEAPDIMAVFGDNFISGAPILRILTLSQLIYAMVGPVALILTMTRYTKLNLFDLILTLILSLVLDFIMIPKYGAFGAAIANAITIGFLNIMRLIQVYYIYRIQPYTQDFIWPIIAGAIASVAAIGCGLLIQNIFYLWRLVIISVLFLSIYGSVIYKYGIDQVDWEAIGSIIQRIRTIYETGIDKSTV